MWDPLGIEGQHEREAEVSVVLQSWGPYQLWRSRRRGEVIQ